MPNVWHVFSFYNSTFANGEVRGVKEVREVKEFKEVKAICLYNQKGCPNHLEQPSNKSKYIYYSVLNLNLLLISFRWVYKSRFLFLFYFENCLVYTGSQVNCKNVCLAILQFYSIFQINIAVVVTVTVTDAEYLALS